MKPSKIVRTIPLAHQRKGPKLDSTASPLVDADEDRKVLAECLERANKVEIGMSYIVRLQNQVKDTIENRWRAVEELTRKTCIQVTVQVRHCTAKYRQQSIPAKVGGNSLDRKLGRLLMYVAHQY